MLLKTFRKISEESEKKWFGAISRLTRYALKLRSDVDLLLGRFFSPEDLCTVTQNDELSKENLVEHKRLIQVLAGAVHTQESLRVEAEARTKLLEQEVGRWLLDWQIMRKDSLLSVYILAH